MNFSFSMVSIFPPYSLSLFFQLPPFKKGPAVPTVESTAGYTDWSIQPASIKKCLNKPGSADATVIKPRQRQCQGSPIPGMVLLSLFGYGHKKTPINGCLATDRGFDK